MIDEDARFGRLATERAHHVRHGRIRPLDDQVDLALHPPVLDDDPRRNQHSRQRENGAS